MTELGKMLRNDGIEIGKEIGEDLLGELTICLLKDSRLEDLEKAAENSGYRKELYREYGIGMVHECGEEYRNQQKV